MQDTLRNAQFFDADRAVQHWSRPKATAFITVASCASWAAILGALALMLG